MGRDRCDGAEWGLDVSGLVGHGRAPDVQVTICTTHVRGLSAYRRWDPSALLVQGLTLYIYARTQRASPRTRPVRACQLEALWASSRLGTQLYSDVLTQRLPMYMTSLYHDGREHARALGHRGT